MTCVDIVIVNWNAGSLLRECVDSIIQHGEGLVNRIVVVDNGSADRSACSIEGLPDVTVIRAGANLGFAKACNMGAAHGNCEFVLFLNPDARLLPGSLSPVIEFMQRAENAMVGICGVQLIGEDGLVARSCARFPSAGGFVARAAGLNRIATRFDHKVSDWDHATTRRVDQVMGAFFLVRRSVFEALQGFDERFFVYFEDLDLAYRARELGWSNVYFAQAQAFHVGGGSSGQVKAQRLFYVLRSRILYTFKHFDPYAATAVLLATLFIEPLSRTVLALGRRSWTSLKETWVAYRMLVRWLPHGIVNEARRKGV